MLTMFQSTRATRSRNAKVRARRATLESLETRQLMTLAGLPAVQHMEINMVFGQTLSQVLLVPPSLVLNPMVSQAYLAAPI